MQYTFDSNSPPLEVGSLDAASARILCPDIRVVSRIAAVFEPLNPNDRAEYNLSDLSSTVTAYRCINAQTRIARVGEIVGKNGIPLQFPKSNIDGVAFATSQADDMPWIDVDLQLAFPGVPGKWVLYYHATSDNKLKSDEWDRYIARVTMSLLTSPRNRLYNNFVG